MIDVKASELRRCLDIAFDLRDNVLLSVAMGHNWVGYGWLQTRFNLNRFTIGYILDLTVWIDQQLGHPITASCVGSSSSKPEPGLPSPAYFTKLAARREIAEAETYAAFKLERLTLIDHVRHRFPLLTPPTGCTVSITTNAAAQA